MAQYPMTTTQPGMPNPQSRPPQLGPSVGINPMAGRSNPAESNVSPKEIATLMEWLKTQPADVQAQFSELLSGDFGAEATDAQAGMDRADLLRAESPEGYRTRGGYRAANPVEHIGSMFQNYASKKLYDEGKAERTEARGQDQELRSQIIRAMKGG